MSCRQYFPILWSVDMGSLFGNIIGTRAKHASYENYQGIMKVPIAKTLQGYPTPWTRSLVAILMMNNCLVACGFMGSYIYIYTHTQTCMHTYIYTCVHLYTYVHMLYSSWTDLLRFQPHSTDFAIQKKRLHNYIELSVLLSFGNPRHPKNSKNSKGK